MMDVQGRLTFLTGSGISPSLWGGCTIKIDYYKQSIL